MTLPAFEIFYSSSSIFDLYYYTYLWRSRTFAFKVLFSVVTWPNVRSLVIVFLLSSSYNLFTSFNSYYAKLLFLPSSLTVLSKFLLCCSSCFAYALAFYNYPSLLGLSIYIHLLDFKFILSSCCTFAFQTLFIFFIFTFPVWVFESIQERALISFELPLNFCSFIQLLRLSFVNHFQVVLFSFHQACFFFSIRSGLFTNLWYYCLF